jgi:hypothetical protein
MDKIELILNFHSSMISSFLNPQDRNLSQKISLEVFSSKARIPEKLDIQRLYFGGSTDNVKNRRV